MGIVKSAGFPRTRAIAWALVLAFAVAAAPYPAAAQELGDKVVASVDGQPITGHDIETFSASVGRPVKADDIANNEAAKAVLKALISQKLLDSEVKKYSNKVDEAQVDRYITQLQADNHMSDAQFRAALAQSGKSYEEVRKQAREQLERAMMIEQEVRERISVSPAEIQAYYDAHKSELTITDERLKLAQILITVPDNATPQQVAAAQAKAESVRKQAAAGADFGELARKYSDDSSKAAGGELGWFEPKDVLDQILVAVRPLKPGEISPVVRSSHGFHILKLEAHDEPGVKPLDQVKGQIREELLNEKTHARLQEWVESDLVKQHDVQMLY
jgi:peptidyl-prolyl cis-trans isomerase SurA